MRLTVLLIIILSISSCTKQPVKTIGSSFLVNKSMYSDIYPAVWFSPSDLTISSIKDDSEIPPEGKYTIWIEPDDPEIQSWIGHFIYVGDGQIDFEKNLIVADSSKKSNEADLMISKNPVYLYIEGESKYLFMLSTLNQKEKELSFMWRKLK